MLQSVSESLHSHTYTHMSKYYFEYMNCMNECTCTTATAEHI